MINAETDAETERQTDGQKDRQQSGRRSLISCCQPENRTSVKATSSEGIVRSVYAPFTLYLVYTLEHGDSKTMSVLFRLHQKRGLNTNIVALNAAWHAGGGEARSWRKQRKGV